MRMTMFGRAKNAKLETEHRKGMLILCVRQHLTCACALLKRKDVTLPPILQGELVCKNIVSLSTLVRRFCVA